ncbi:hypothetical protein VFDL14_04490 [Vibrio fortis]|uniref:Uncharacterized protein n=1 Tax=Vibrio fortis TaxID=212667 RepID=A0A066UXP4_9VIBR|nr:hypothetical protein VFDL14_04490 [Vibrio fortis]
MSKFVRELHEQYELWVNYLNYTMAPWIFALAVGCFLGDSPRWLTFLCIAFICLWGYQNPQYPPSLIRLRKNRQINTNADYLYRGFVSKNMSLFAVVKNMHLFFVAVLFLGLVFSGVTKSTVGF